MRTLRREAFRLAAITVLSLGLTLLITQPTINGRIAQGQVAHQTYKAPRTVTYKSDLKTNEAEQKASEGVGAVYRPDLTAGSQQESKYQATIGGVNAVRAAASPGDEKIKKLGELLPNVTPNEAAAILALDDQGWQQATALAHDALGKLQAQRVKQDDLANADRLADGVIPKSGPAGVRSTAIVLVRKLLLPNFVIDQEATDTAKTKAKDAVEPISYTMERDQVIAYRGQTLTDFDVERLAAAGLSRPAFNWQKSAGVFLLTFLFSALLLLVGPRFARPSKYPRRLYALVTIFALGITLTGVIVVPVQPILAYILPICGAGLLVSIFYGFTYALIAGTAFVAFFALAAGGSFELFFIHLATTVATLIFARRIINISSFLRIGTVSAGVVFLGITAFSLLAANFDPANLPKFLLAATLEGALTSTFVFAGTAFLGGPLGIVTFLQLLELENPRHPLLRKLAHEAPGTYSHSLRIAGWVEDLAEAVEADPLLARVQALYHDVGKSNLAEYYVENQGGTNNLHSRLSPKESAEVLRAHISEGLSLAAGAGLPEAVSAAIPEHHGTALMGFFWDTAKRRYKTPKQEDYRYLGPKPQSKETAILMLADAVEAASRTVENPDREKIDRLIHSLLTERLEDGQLDEAPLQARELTTLRKAFTERVLADLHKRVRYPARTRDRT